MSDIDDEFDDNVPASNRKTTRKDNQRTIDDDGSIAGDQLKSIIERIERLEEDKKAVTDDIKEVYGEAKANGFDTKILRKIVSLRKVAAAERAEEEAILEIYLQALGMV